MTKPGRKGAEQARSQLPALLADAERGRTTIITRHGRGVAALVPLASAGLAPQRSLIPLAGSGKGLWGKRPLAAVRRLRDEWNA